MNLGNFKLDKKTLIKIGLAILAVIAFFVVKTYLVPDSGEGGEDDPLVIFSELPVKTDSPSETDAPEETDIPSQTDSPDVTETPSKTATPKNTSTPKPTATPKKTATATPKKTATPKPTATAKTIDINGVYSSKEDVALYIHTYGKLPNNYISKDEAEALGWPGGSLEKYAPGKMIGGSYFGNYEGILPKKNGRKYTECDIDTLGKSSRGSKRIVFSNDGLIYYTEDHYETFELLYGNP